jgi:hypothetical protein
VSGGTKKNNLHPEAKVLSSEGNRLLGARGMGGDPEEHGGVEVCNAAVKIGLGQHQFDMLVCTFNPKGFDDYL